MTKTIKYQNSEIEYIQSKENKIITILAWKSEGNGYLNCLRRLELLAKRIKIKELWIPSYPPEMDSDLKKMGYKLCVLGVHPELKSQLNGWKKLL